MNEVSFQLYKSENFISFVIYINCFRLSTFFNRLQTSGREAFLQALQETEKKIEAERQQVLEKQQKNSVSNVSQKDLTPPWPTEQIQLLTKAVNLFPAGTYQRLYDNLTYFLCM